MSKTQTAEAQIAPTNAPYNPFSAELMNLINAAQPTETTETMEANLGLLINYFVSNNATNNEIYVIRMTNDNDIFRLVNSLRNYPESREALRSTVAQVVTNARNAELDADTESDADMDTDTESAPYVDSDADTEPYLYEDRESDIEPNADEANTPNINRQLDLDHDSEGDVEMAGDSNDNASE